MNREASTEIKGLLGSVGAMAATLVAAAHTRLDLLSLDLEEDREHLLSLTLTALGAVFCLGVGVVLSALFLVVVFWETHRVGLLGFLCGLFLIAGLLAAFRARRMARTKPRLFASSLSELIRDGQELVSRS